MYCLGADHHKRSTYVTSLRDDGSVHLQRNLPADAATLSAFFGAHPRPFIVGIEATYAWEYVADIVEGLGAEIRVGHPLLLKAFARRHRKNDRIDSRLMAERLRRGDFPAIAHPPKVARQRRDLYRQRMELVARRTGASSRAKAFADRLGFQAEMNLSTAQGIGTLAALPVGPGPAKVLASHVRWLTFLYQEIERLERVIDAVAVATPETQWLMSMPGIGPYLALLIASEVFDVGRFPNADHFAAYAGVVPGTQMSGGRVLDSHMGSCANQYLRWAFTAAAYHYQRQCPPLQRKYQRLKRAKGWKTARLAVARHVALVAYHLLQERRPYQPGPCPSRRTTTTANGGFEGNDRDAADGTRGRTLLGSAGMVEHRPRRPD